MKEFGSEKIIFDKNDSCENLDNFSLIGLLNMHRWCLHGSLLDFHQTLQTCSYMQDKNFKQKSKGKGPILLELFPFVVLIGF